jgi:transcriptional regulator NrdR family protein
VTGTQDFGTTVQRYRRCPICDHRWRTWEEKDAHVVRAKRGKSVQEGDLFAEAARKSNG